MKAPEVVHCVLCRGMLPAEKDGVFLSHMRDQHRVYVNQNLLYSASFLDDQGIQKTTDFINTYTDKSRESDGNKNEIVSNDILEGDETKGTIDTEAVEDSSKEVFNNSDKEPSESKGTENSSKVILITIDEEEYDEDTVVNESKSNDVIEEETVTNESYLNPNDVSEEVTVPNNSDLEVNDGIEEETVINESCLESNDVIEKDRFINEIYLEPNDSFEEEKQSVDQLGDIYDDIFHNWELPQSTEEDEKEQSHDESDEEELSKGPAEYENVPVAPLTHDEDTVLSLEYLRKWDRWDHSYSKNELKERHIIALTAGRKRRDQVRHKYTVQYISTTGEDVDVGMEESRTLSDVHDDNNIKDQEHPTGENVCDNQSTTQGNLKTDIQPQDVKDEELEEPQALSKLQLARLELCRKVCGEKIFGTIQSQRSHLAREHRLEFTECPHCPRRFRTEKLLEKHINFRHKPRPTVCHICGLSSKDPSYLAYHIKHVHYAKPETCPECGMVCTSKISLKNHRRNNHSKVVCPECGIKIKEVSLNEHLVSKHGKDHLKKYTCDVCGKGFAILHSMKEHRAIHDEARPFPCRYENCNFASKSSGNRIKHEIGKHGRKKKKVEASATPDDNLK